jgi:uncharacterized protein (TIGR02996 family)
VSNEITNFPRLYDEPDAIPFINSIILNPDDDTNRLVFADWLEENEHRDEEFADHYRARCEFIQIGCNSLGGSLKRISKSEGEWLDANWRRLVPTFSRWLKYAFITPYVSDYYFMKRTGRRINIRYGQYVEKDSRWLGAFDAIRGFTNFAAYNSKSTPHYSALLMDDPVADPFRYMTGYIKYRGFIHDDALVLTRSDMPYYLFRNLEYYCDGSGLIIENIPKKYPYSEPQVAIWSESGGDVRELVILAFHRAMRKWVKEKKFKVGAIND